MKVKVLPFQPHSLAFGGFEKQMLDAMSAAKSVGVEISPLDVWSKKSDFDILHLWGLGENHITSVNYAKAAGKKITMTALLPYLTYNLTLRKAFNNFFRIKSSISYLLSKIDILVVVNEEQAITASKFYGLKRSKIKIIPNIVSDIFFEEDYSGNNQEFKDYVICVGTICSRKNQMMLAKASLELNSPILFVGPGMPGEEAYVSNFGKYINNYSNLKWIDGIEPDSKEIIAAYKNSIGFALPSYNETQPIAALEAAAMSKPLLLANLSWAKQDLYKNSYLVDPKSIDSIKNGLKKMTNNMINAPLKPLVCNAKDVGSEYKNVYKLLCND